MLVLFYIDVTFSFKFNERFCPSVCISFAIFLIVTLNSSQNNKEDFVDLMQVCILQAANNSWNIKKTQHNSNNRVKSLSSIVHSKNDWARVTFSQRLVEAISG